MGTFSKALGCVGGYVVGSKDLCVYLQNKVRSYLLSGSHPPAVAGACIAALQLVQKQPFLVKKLWDHTRYFKKGLKDIVKLAQEHNAMTYVDDAHGDGVLGENGRGITNHFHLEGKVDVDMGTFSKAFGCVGGYVVGSKDLCVYLQNKVRSYLLSGSHPPAVAGACIAALQIVQKQPSLVKKLWDNTRYFKKGLKDIGFDTGNSETPITPVIVGEAGKARELADNLFKLGVFVLPIVFPMVARDKARVRTIVTSAHTRKDLYTALRAFEKAGKQLALI